MFRLQPEYARIALPLDQLLDQKHKMPKAKQMFKYVFFFQHVLITLKTILEFTKSDLATWVSEQLAACCVSFFTRPTVYRVTSICDRHHFVLWYQSKATYYRSYCNTTCPCYLTYVRIKNQFEYRVSQKKIKRLAGRGIGSM